MMKIPILKCPITDLQVSSSRNFGYPNPSGEEQYEYTIRIGSYDIAIQVPITYTSWDKDSFFYSNKHLIAGLLLNEKLFSFEGGTHTLWLERIKCKLEEAIFPGTPQEKYDNLLQKLFKFQEYEGATIAMGSRFHTPEFYYGLFFKNKKELLFYIKTIRNDGLLDAKITGNADYDMETLDSCNLTYKGLSYVLKLMDEDKQSKNCFIAMSFGSEMGSIRSAIKAACLATGYTPVLVDEVHYDSDTTINDAIISNLKKSRFCIADFTEQKDGVYFESGFALGQGKQVIYACQKEWFNKSHFDTNHFPHIVYETPDGLKTSLINKIEAWIR